MTEQAEDIRFYCGISEGTWNRHRVRPGPYACISPVYGRRDDLSPSDRLNRVRVPLETRVIQDSGAFSDGPLHRLSCEEALERQQAHAERFGYAAQITHRASYDLLIDEKWTQGIRSKARWSEADAEFAVTQTMRAARFLSEHRTPGIGAILSAQGVSARQYLACAQALVPYLADDDIFGLGGWCITGMLPKQFLPVFRETMHALLPFLAREGIRRVHIWGVCYAPALGELLYLCDQGGIALSTDSAGPSLRPCLGKWGYSSWTRRNYQQPPVEQRGRHRMLHIYLTRRWLRDFRHREARYYRFTPVKSCPIQLPLLVVEEASKKPGLRFDPQ